MKYGHPRDEGKTRFLLTYSDFLMATQPAKKYCTKEALGFAFAMMDSKRQLCLTTADFCRVAHKIGLVYDAAEIKKEADKFYDVIDIDSFIEICTGSQQ